MKRKNIRLVPHGDDALWTVLVTVLWMVVIVLTFSCNTVPVTGRQQLSLVSGEELNAMSSEQYREFLSQHTVVRGTRESRMVADVGRNIKNAVQD